MKNILRMAAVLLFSGMVLGSCDSLENTAITVNLGEQSFDIPLANQLVRSGETADYASFAGSYTLNLNDPMFAKVKEQGELEKVEFMISNVELKVTPAEGVEDLVIVDFKSDATGITPGYEKATIELDEYFNDDALKTYIGKIFASVQDDNAVTVSVSGKSNATSVEQIGNVEVKVTLKAKVWPFKK